MGTPVCVHEYNNFIPVRKNLVGLKIKPAPVLFNTKSGGRSRRRDQFDSGG